MDKIDKTFERTSADAGSGAGHDRREGGRQGFPSFGPRGAKHQMLRCRMLREERSKFGGVMKLSAQARAIGKAFGENAVRDDAVMFEKVDLIIVDGGGTGGILRHRLVDDGDTVDERPGGYERLPVVGKLTKL